MLTATLTPEQIRTAPYMKLAGESKEYRQSVLERDSYVAKVEVYHRGDEWFLIIYYNDEEEIAKVLPDDLIPGGWFDIGQVTGSLFDILN